MKVLVTAAGFIATAAVVSLSAQWPAYPTAGVPKTADGKPDLSAPAPRMADGKPDLSGIWVHHSIGKWEGDTLVVETIGFRDEGWLDVNGSPYTDALKLTERFRRVNYGTLDMVITVDDPKAYTKPWTVKMDQRILLDSELIEFICAENEQSSHHYAK